MTLQPIESADSPAVASTGRTRRSGVVNMGIKLGGTALAFALNILLARSMSPESFAEVSVALAWLALATALGCLSTPLVLMRFLGENLAAGRSGAARGVVRYSMVVAAGSSVLLVLVSSVALAAGWLGVSPQAMPVAVLCIALIVPNALLSLVTGLLQALKHALAAEFIGSVLRSVLLLVVLSAYWAASGRGVLASSAVLEIYLCVALLLLLLAGWLANRAHRTAIAPAAPVYETRQWTRAGVALLAVLLAAAANERIDLLMLGWRATGAEVASYAVAQRFAQVLLFAANAVGAVMAPHFVASLPALRAGRTADAQALVRSSAKLTLLTCLIASIGFALAGPWLTGLFGSHYASAYVPLLILIGGQTVAALFGPGTLVATLSGQSRFAVANLVLAIAVNAALNALLVPWLGATGAALATASAGMISAAMAHAGLKRALGIRIDALPMRAPAAARVAAP